MERTIRDIDPKLCASSSTIPAWCEYKTPEFPNSTFRIFRDPYLERDGNWPVGTVRVTLPGDGVKEKLAAKWGAPRESDGNVYWYNTDARIRVAMHPAKIPNDPPGSVDLDYSVYIPIAELIGDDKALFGFELGKPLLGASASAVEKRYGLRVGRSVAATFDQAQRYRAATGLRAASPARPRQVRGARAESPGPRRERAASHRRCRACTSGRIRPRDRAGSDR